MFTYFPFSLKVITYIDKEMLFWVYQTRYTCKRIQEREF